MPLEYTSDATFLPPMRSTDTQNFEPMSLCSITSDASRLVSASAVNMCDPYWDLQVPANHPLRSLLYGEGSRLATNEALNGVTRLGDNRVSVRAEVGEGDNQQKVAMDIARLPGGAYYVRDLVNNSTTVFLNDGTKIKMDNDGQALISSAAGIKRVKDSFLMNSGDSMIKINPRTGGVHIFSNDGNVTTVTSPEYWTPPQREEHPKKFGVFV